MNSSSAESVTRSSGKRKKSASSIRYIKCCTSCGVRESRSSVRSMGGSRNRPERSKTIFAILRYPFCHEHCELKFRITKTNSHYAIGLLPHFAHEYSIDCNKCLQFT